jgi:hypothetical protein
VAQEFAHITACPSDAVTVVPRPDYRIPTPPEMQPPPEIAADSQYLVEWQKRAEAARRLDAQTPCGAAFSTFDAFEVSGCGRRVILCCPHPPTPIGEGSCIAMPPTATPPKAAPAASSAP